MPSPTLAAADPLPFPFSPSGPEHRQRLEAVEALGRAMPIQDRIAGEDAWNMSLRDAWERIVPVGNVFSGLFAVIREKPGDRCGHFFIDMERADRVAGCSHLMSCCPPPTSCDQLRVGRPLDPLETLPPLAGLSSTVFTNSLKSAAGFTKPPLLGSTGATGSLGAPGTLGGLGTFTKGGRSLTLRGRDWQHSEWLKTRTELYAK